MGWTLRTGTPALAEEGPLIQHKDDVTAILVCHRGSKHLGEVIRALAEQTRPIDHLIVVDSAADEATRRLLDERLPDDAHLVTMRENQGFSSAVKYAATIADELGHRSDPTRRWLWLIHDDSAPAEGALEHLLAGAEISPSVTIAGCKQVRWHDPRKLIDVGLGMSTTGQRLTLINREEIDQDQYNDRSDVFAVNSAGMLIRSDCFADMKGFDPALEMVGDELDICWRNRLAGHRVIVVPEALVRHDEPLPPTVDHRAQPVSGSWFLPQHQSQRDKAGELTGRLSPTGRRARWRSQTFLRLKFAPAWQLPLLWCWLLISGLGHLIAGIASKNIGSSLARFSGTLAGLFRFAALARSRREVKNIQRVPRDVVQNLLTPQRDVRAHAKANEIAAEQPVVVGDGTGVANTSYEPTGDRDDFTAMAAPERAWAGAGALVAVVVLTLLSVLFHRHLLAAPAAVGGAMLPVSGDLGLVLHHASSWWTDLSTGSSHHVDPFAWVLVVLGALGLGNTSAATVVTLFIGMPLAGLAAWFLAAGITDSRGIRFFAALSWGLAPVLQASLAQGRLAAVIFHALLPLFVLALIRAAGAGLDPKLYLDPVAMRRTEVEMVLKPGINSVPSYTAAGAASLLMAVLVACAPATLIPLLCCLVLMFILIGRRAKTLWFVPLPAMALMAPVWVQDWNNPRALLADPGRPHAFDPAPLWQQLLGIPTAFDPQATTPTFSADFIVGNTPYAVISLAVMIVPAVLALIVAVFVPKLRGTITRFALLGAAAVIAFYTLCGGIVTAADGAEVVTIFPGPAISTWVLVLLIGAIVTLDVLGRQRNAANQQQRLSFTLTTGVLLGTLSLGVVLAGAHLLSVSFAENTLSPTADSRGRALTDWGTTSQVRPGSQRLIPATSADQALGPYRTRTLQITADNANFDGALINGAATTLDALSAGHHARQFTGPLEAAAWAEPDPADERVKAVVAKIVAGDSLDPRKDLEELAVAFVYLADPANEQQNLAARIDSVPGLAPVGRTENGWLWRAVPAKQLPDAQSSTDFTSRMRLVNAHGGTVQRIASERDAAQLHLESSQAPRYVVISHRADPGWKVTFNGRELSPVQAPGVVGEPWQAAFKVPAEAGELSIKFHHEYQTPVVLAQALVFFLAILLAIPVSRRARFVPLAPQQRAERRSSVNEETPTEKPAAADEEPAESAVKEER